MDTADLGSVRAALSAIGEPLHGVLLNAGGTGGPTPMARTPEGVTTIFASNVLGHAVLLEGLIDARLLRSTAVLTGSEAARGVPKLRMKRPTFATRSVDEFASVMDGSFFSGRKFDPMLAYGQVKYLGALWMSALARQHPDLRLLTVSPGNTSGTDALRDMATVQRVIMQRVVMPYVAPMLGLSSRWTSARSGWWTPCSAARCQAERSTRAQPRHSPARSSTSPASSPTSPTRRLKITPTRRSIASSTNPVTTPRQADTKPLTPL